MKAEEGQPAFYDVSLLPLVSDPDSIRRLEITPQSSWQADLIPAIYLSTFCQHLSPLPWINPHFKVEGNKNILWGILETAISVIKTAY